MCNGDESQLSDEVIGQVCEAVRPVRPDGHGAPWRVLAGEEKRIKDAGLLQRGNVLGHEYVGEVVEVGAGVAGWKVGDRLVALPAKPCGRCAACQAGRADECSQIVMQGFDPRMPGAYAESRPAWRRSRRKFPRI